MGPKPTPRHTLERVNSKGNYDPGNCVWATYAAQNRNRSSNRYVTIGSDTKCIGEWAEIVGIHRNSMYARIDRGLTGEALLAPPGRNSDKERREGLGL
jgi:hypothetical protein